MKHRFSRKSLTVAISAALLGLFAATGEASAHGRDRDRDRGHRHGGYHDSPRHGHYRHYAHRPVRYVYAPPRPVYYAPQPVYYGYGYAPAPLLNIHVRGRF